MCFTEEPVPDAPEGVIWSLWDCQGQREFLERHADNLEAQGRKPRRGWKASHVRGGYSFRFDAVKFSRQCFIPEYAASLLPDGEVMVWLDADVVTLADVPAGFVEELLGGADVAYLGRQPKHSEIGFWACRIGPETRAWLAELADLFRSDAIFELKEWHSAFAWDHTRRLFEAGGAFGQGIDARNLTPGGSGHVWCTSPLAPYMDHLKGKRKAKGKSPERRR